MLVFTKTFVAEPPTVLLFRSEAVLHFRFLRTNGFVIQFITPYIQLRALLRAGLEDFLTTYVISHNCEQYSIVWQNVNIFLHFSLHPPVYEKIRGEGYQYRAGWPFSQSPRGFLVFLIYAFQKNPPGLYLKKVFLRCIY